MLVVCSFGDVGGGGGCQRDTSVTMDATASYSLEAEADGGSCGVGDWHDMNEDGRCDYRDGGEIFARYSTGDTCYSEAEFGDRRDGSLSVSVEAAEFGVGNVYKVGDEYFPYPVDGCDTNDECEEIPDSIGIVLTQTGPSYVYNVGEVVNVGWVIEYDVPDAMPVAHDVHSYGDNQALVVMQLE